MPTPNRRQLEEENRVLREALEEVYDRVAEILGIEDEDSDEEDAD